MRIKTLLEHMKRFKDDVEVVIESPINKAHCYAVTTISQAEHGGRPILVFTSSEDSKAPCHRCEEARSAGTMSYSLDYFKDGVPCTIFVDVGRASTFAQQHSELLTVIPDKDAGALVLVNLSETFCGRHVEHVDDSPSLIALYENKMLLLDGTHRMMRSLKKGLPARAYLLSQDVLMHFVIGDVPREVS